MGEKKVTMKNLAKEGLEVSGPREDDPRKPKRSDSEDN